jgi:hypothetical protein
MDLSLDLSTYHATESRHLVYQDDIGAMSTLALEWRSIPEAPSKTPAIMISALSLSRWRGQRIH